MTNERLDERTDFKRRKTAYGDAQIGHEDNEEPSVNGGPQDQDGDQDGDQDDEDQDDEDQEDRDHNEVPIDEPAMDEALYLPTIQRKLLDFDFEKVCSISLSNINVYACLTCGKYFQGRGRTSYAYLHSIETSHRLYINLTSLKVYVLPDNYVVQSKALDDIKYVIKPSYTKDEVLQLDAQEHRRVCYDLDRKPYYQGFIGLNNLKYNDYANSVIQALSHVVPLRDYLLLADFDDMNEKNPSQALLARNMSTLVKKLWNPKAFKAHVSPYELLQQIAVASKSRFVATKTSDPFSFMNYLLNNLHLALGGSRIKPKSSIVQKIFQGRLRMVSQDIKTSTRDDRVLSFDLASDAKVQETPFMFLSLDLPAAPLFKDSLEQESIPQVPLTKLLAKYNGETNHELPGQVRRYKLLDLPEYLVFNIKRTEKSVPAADGSNDDVNSMVNPTVVSFTPRNLDMSAYLEGATDGGANTAYDLVANIVRVQSGDKFRYAVQVFDESRKEWFKFEDLRVEPIQHEFLFLEESYIQIWRRQT